MLKRILFVVVLFYCNTIRAQLCTGSLGDPVVHLDFGSGTANFAGALGSGITSYNYVAQSFPNDGSYTVEATTAGAGTVWWSTTDHTGGGYMMVVNASTSVTDYFYKKSVSGLCPNTTYEFAAWIVNLLRSRDNNPPNVTFSIYKSDGTTLIQSYTTGSIPLTASGPEWKQFGFYFTTPAGVQDVVIKMSNSSPGGAPANDLALDDITFRPCGPNLTAALVTGGTSKSVCRTDNTVFSLQGTISNSYTNPSFQWQVSTDNGITWTDIAGATSTTYVRQSTAEGTYEYRLEVAQGTNIGSSGCRTASNIITINVLADPAPNAQSNNPGCEGDALNLTATGDATSTYQWTGPNGFTSAQQNPVINNITSAGNGTYTVAVTTSLGCSNSSSTTVDVNPAPGADAGADAFICEGSSTNLQGSGGNTFSWTPATTLSDVTSASPVASPTDTTSYILTVSNGQCSARDTVTVFVWKKPTASAGPDQQIFEGDAATLTGSAGGSDITYTWTPDYNINDAASLTPTVTPESDTTYTLTVTSADGCGSASDGAFVRVYKKISIPNAFSPNGDGINDTWNINKLDTYPEADISVFNRYGQLVYRSTGYTTPWNGRYNGQPLPVGTYYYVIDLKTGFGKNPAGWVVILR